MDTQNKIKDTEIVKATEIVKVTSVLPNLTEFEAMQHCAIEAMKWKDEEHKKEKQQMINKICDWLKHHIYDYFYWIEMEGENEANIKLELFTDLKQVMKED
jgi:hypothetical protein